MDRQPLTPYLSVSDASAASAFYQKAFSAVEIMRQAAPGQTRLMHVHIKINGSDLMFADDFSDKMGGKPENALALGGTPLTLHLQVDDAQAVWDQAVAAGATVTMPLADQFWGDRYGQLRDPFGNRWSIGQTIAKPTPEEIQEAAKAAF